ncbi:MAG: InlB B-repeat-containing protein [Endomicrobium sp.]|jgi:hypothetical protein|nr:InlB B-repeat-containing protein [Endomicrobium sp.]
MFIPLAVMIPCSIVAFFEFWQQRVISNAQLKINEILPSQIPQGQERLFILNKLLAALPKDLSSQVQDLINLKDGMDVGVVMNYHQGDNKIYINVSLIRELFFDKSGKNITNQKLLVTFLKHELAHKEFADSQNKVRFFIHKIFPWLEEFFVSFGDIFRWFSQLSFIRQLLNYNTVPIKWTLPKGIKIPNLPGRVNNGMFIEEPVIVKGRVVLPDGRRGVMDRIVKINGAEDEEFEFGKTIVDTSVIKSIEIEYVFKPDNYTVKYITNGGTLNTDVSSWSVNSGTSYNVPAIPADKLPTRQGYDLLGCEYLIPSTGEIRKISLEEMQRGFNIPVSDINEDVNIILRWKPETHEVAYVDGDNIIRLEQRVEAGEALRVRGLGRGAGVGRFFNALVGRRAGVRPHKIKFEIQDGIPSPENMPKEMDADEGIVLNAPEIPEGIVQLKDGRRGIVKRIVEKAGGEEVSFIYGETKITEDLTIRYVFEPYEYSLVYKENDGTYAQPLDGNVIVNGQANRIAGINSSAFPQKDGYMFAGYKCMNSHGQVITISRFDVEKGFEIPLEGSYGDVSLIAQWTKIEEKDNYTITFETESSALTPQILSAQELMLAERGKPLLLPGQILKLGAKDLQDNNWDVRGYEVLINGVSVFRVDANKDGQFDDASVPADLIQGEVTIKFISYPKIRFINLENHKEYSVSLEQGFTEKDLKKLLKKELGINNKKDLWWKRSDNQFLSQIVTSPITIEVSNLEFKGSRNITILDQAIDYIKTLPLASIIWSIVWTAFNNLELPEKIGVVVGIASVVTLLLLMIVGSMPWIFIVSGLISIIFIVIKIVMTLFNNIKNELLKQVAKELDGDLFQEIISAINEGIESVLGILQTHVVQAMVQDTTLDTIQFVFYGMAAYTVIFAILVSFGIISSSFLLAIPFIFILGFVVWKIRDSINNSDSKEQIISFADKVLGIFKDLFNNLKIPLKLAVIGCFIGILAGVISIFTVSSFAFIGLLIFGAIFGLSALLFFILFNQDKTIEILKQRLHGTEVGRLFGETIGIVGIVSAANQDIFVNNFSVGQILKLVHKISKISWSLLDNFPIFPIIRKIIKALLGIALRHSKQYAFRLFKEKAGNIADRIKKGRVISEIRGLANNVHEAMTDIADSIGDVPTKEGYEFDGFIIKKQDSDAQLRVTREQADSDFVIPPEFTDEDVRIVLVWKPKIIIVTGDGRRRVLAHTTKDPLEILPEDNSIVSLKELSDKLKPPKGFDYASLYWTCDAPEFVDREFKADETIEVHEHCTFTPHWKPLPEIKIAAGTEQKMGQWKKATGNAAVQERAPKVKATPEGALIDLRPFIDSLVAPEDCDPESLYWTIGNTDERAEVHDGMVIAKGNTVYTPHWLTYAQAGKVKIKTKKDKYKVVKGNSEGKVDLKDLEKRYKLKTPDGYIEGSLYWTRDGSEDHLSGVVDIRDISILTPHWVANSAGYSVSFVVGKDGQIKKMRCVIGEEFPSKDVSKYAVEIFDGVKQKRDKFYTRVFKKNNYTIPKRKGFKVKGVKVQAGDFEKEYPITSSYFTIPPADIKGQLKITLVWEQDREKSAESAESTAEAALKIGAELAMSSAALTASNGLSLELIESMRVVMNSFADFERFQLAEIQKAEQIAEANNYSDSSSEEKRELINRLLKVLPSDLAAEFMQHFSNEEIKETGVVMSYNPESDVIRVNYALLRAMFIDESGENIKNIDLFKVFVKHELKHREFAKSSNPLYKSVHAISSLEEFFVSMGDIYAWQELHGQQGSLISYNDIFRFILSNAKYISILANITLEEATIIANLAAIQEEGDPYSFDINDDKKSLRLVVVDSADGLSNSDALSNAQTWTQNGYSAALIEHLPSEGYLNDRYVMPSYNISFGEMVYEVYIRQVNGVHFIGLKLKSGQDTTQNFAAAVQFFANDINTNARLRQAFGSLSKLKDSNPSYGIEKDLEINNNGVVMIDFIGMQIEPDTIEATQKLYQPEEFSSGLNGTYTVVDMPITNDTLTEVEQDIKASMLHKLDRPEKFYQVDIPDLKLSDSNFIERAVKIKKKEGATTLILNINDLDLNMLSSESMIETLKGFIAIVHSFELTATIQIDASKINEELSRSVLALGFDGISIEAQDIEDVNLLRQILEELTIASRENSISEKNTIHLKNQSVRDSLGDLAGMNVLTITKIDEETHQAELDANQAREVIELGYERGRRVLEQKISMDAKNIRALLNIITQDSSTISAGEIMQAVENAGINAILQKHIGIILKGVDSNLTGTNTKVLEAIGFVRGLIEAYTISRYLETFSISFEMFNTNDLNEIRALGALLTALLIIDRDNKFFKDSFALRSLFEQANAVFGELSTEDSLSDLKKQIISFANLVVERFEERKSIDDIALDKDNPSQKLYMSLAVVNDLINKISFSNIIDNAKRRALGSTKQQTRSILGAA